MTPFVAQPGSKVSIKGSNDIHEFDIQGKEIHGEAVFAARFPATVTPGKTRVRIEGFIPVRSLHYGVGTAMDKTLYHHLKAEAHPRILFRFSELTLKAVPNTNGVPFRFDAQGELVVAGVTNQISMPIQVFPVDENKLKLVVNASVKMTDFGIQPPRLRLANKDASLQEIKYRDEIELSVEWLVGRQPASATKERP
jgi:hypothetical protein